MIIIKIEDSQNFLHNKDLVKKIVDLANIEENDDVIEIGPGKGIITDALLEKKANITALELDNRLFLALQDKYKGNRKISLKNENALDFDTFNMPSYIIYSNIPFNITSDILNKYLYDAKLSRMYLIMQYEAYLRYKGNNDNYQAYKMLLYKPFYNMDILYKFSPNDFKPSPNARIILASFIKKDKPDLLINEMPYYFDFIAYLFAKKSKLLREKIEKLFTTKQIEIIFKKYNYDADILFTSVGYEELLYIYKMFIKLSDERKKKIISSFYIKKIEEEKKNDQNAHKNFSNKNKW